MASANLDILVSVGGLVYELESAANKNGATIYYICHRNAGWAIQWHEQKKQGESENWKDGLVIYRYYETLEAMVKGEFLRLGESPTQLAPDAGESAPLQGSFYTPDESKSQALSTPTQRG